MIGVVGFSEHESDETFYGHVFCTACLIIGAISVYKPNPLAAGSTSYRGTSAHPAYQLENSLPSMST